MITREQLVAIMPNVDADHWLTPLVNALFEFEINTPARQIEFLPQIAHESGELRWVREFADGLRYNGRYDLGNTSPDAIRIAALHGSTPGPWWKGEGPMQVTGYDNHLACGTALGYDLMNNPRKLEEPEAGMRSAGWFWTVGAGKNLSVRAKAAGIPVGVNLNSLADAEDFEKITLAINGGFNGLPHRRMYRERAQKVLT